jgi:hypothetical protein
MSLPGNEVYDGKISVELVIALFQCPEVKQFEADIRKLVKLSADSISQYCLSLSVVSLNLPLFPLSVGFMVALRNLLNGMTMRDLLARPVDGDMAYKYFTFCFYFTSDKQSIMDDWTPASFLAIANESARKSNNLKSHEDRLQLNTVYPSNILPDHFSDVEMLASVSQQGTCRDENFRNRYDLTCGLLIKVRTGIMRLIKRTQLRLARPDDEAEFGRRLYLSVKFFLIPRYQEALLAEWDECSLYKAAVELSIKAISLSGNLQQALNFMPLVKRRVQLEREEAPEFELVFTEEFLQRVSEYHATTERPDGTFQIESIIPRSSAATGDSNRDLSLAKSEANTQLESLSQLQRESCPSCASTRQVYCGPCGGVRMPLASALLPDRINLPFDVLLLLHWYVCSLSNIFTLLLRSVLLFCPCRHETLQKCTGIHAAAMSLENSVSVAHWKREKGETAREKEDIPGDDETCEAEPIWGPVVRMLDASRDVLLFPDSSAISADKFDWKCQPGRPGRADCLAESSDVATPKWRLVVLEASWMYGKSMYRRIVKYRNDHGLAPLQCVTLENVVGGYWKFHNEGHGAVSSIEAIAHAAAAAGLDANSLEAFLVLFRLQKYRVLDRITAGGKPPRAVCVAGVGIGSWKSLTDALDPRSKES